MQIALSATRPTDAQCLIVPIAKDAAITPPVAAQGLVDDAAASARFAGEAGSPRCVCCSSARARVRRWIWKRPVRPSRPSC